MRRDVAIVGAGYVGVPLAHAFAEVGKKVVLVDIDATRVEELNRGESYIEDIPSETLKPLVERGLIEATTDYDVLRDADAILIALQTPLSKQREPDLSIVTAASIASGSSSTRMFAPTSTVAVHSVEGRRVTQGTPYQYASF